VAATAFFRAQRSWRRPYVPACDRAAAAIAANLSVSDRTIAD
jgi:hypothetical protein